MLCIVMSSTTTLPRFTLGIFSCAGMSILARRIPTIIPIMLFGGVPANQPRLISVGMGEQGKWSDQRSPS